jgi:hypothetical protein
VALDRFVKMTVARRDRKVARKISLRRSPNDQDQKAATIGCPISTRPTSPLPCIELFDDYR